jgi:hypothetical protein
MSGSGENAATCDCAHVRRRRSAAVRCVLLFVVLTSVYGLAAASGAGALEWSSPASAGLAARNLGLHDALLGVSCPSEALCVATDEQGNIFTSTNPTGGQSAWSAPLQVDAGRAIHSVSCPSAKLCVAVDGYGNALVSTEPAGGVAAWHLTKIDPNISSGEGDQGAQISCPTTKLCVAIVGDEFFNSTEPAGGESKWKVVAAPGSAPGLFYSALTCVSESLCVVDGTVAEDMSSLSSTTDPASGSPTWKTTGTDPSAFGGVGALSCPSTSLCVGGDYSSNIVSSTEPAKGPWTASAFVAGGGANAMSCPTTTLCVGGTNGGKIIGSTEPAGGASKWKAFEVDDYTPIAALSCAPGTTLCAAVDYSGDVLATKNPLGGASAWKVSRAGATLSFAAELLSGLSGGRGAIAATLAVNGGEYAGGPAPLKEVVLKLPAGTVLDTSGHPTCSAAILQQSGPQRCPAGSAAASEAGEASTEVSFGDERVEEIATVETFYAPSGGLIFYIFGHSPVYLEMIGEASLSGNAMTLRLPEDETVPGAPFVSVDDLNFRLGETLVEELAFASESPLTLPSACPAGHFSLATEVTLAAAGGLKELSLVGSGQTGCPKADETSAERKRAEKEAEELRLHHEEHTQTTSTGETGTTETGTTSAGEEEAVKRREAEKAAFQKHQAEEVANKKAAEEAAAKKAAGEAAAKKAAEEAALRKQQEQESTAKAAAALGHLAPAGKSSKIAALLKHSDYIFAFTAPSAGILVIDWYEVPKGAHLSTKASPILIATGTRTFSNAAPLKVTIRLTAKGKQLLKHTNQLKITEKASFTPAGGKPVVTQKVFTLKR